LVSKNDERGACRLMKRAIWGQIVEFVGYKGDNMD